MAVISHASSWSLVSLKFSSDQGSSSFRSVGRFPVQECSYIPCCNIQWLRFRSSSMVAYPLSSNSLHPPPFHQTARYLEQWIRSYWRLRAICFSCVCHIWVWLALGAMGKVSYWGLPRASVTLSSCHHFTSTRRTEVGQLHLEVQSAGK